MNDPWTDVELQTYEAHVQDTDEGSVSDSPYLYSFAVWDTIHKRLRKVELTYNVPSIECSLSKRMIYPLPNGKTLLRLDYLRL